MKCARLQLQERSKTVTKSDKVLSFEKPRRYCQKRMVNPEHEEDPRWTDVFERFHCNKEDKLNDAIDTVQAHQDDEDLYLTVQTLIFQGDVEQRKRPRTSFKYKTLPDARKHRMFVKQAVQEEHTDADRSSQLTCYFFDDYVEYLYSNDRSRPGSGKSTLFPQVLNNTSKETKATQVDIVSDDKMRKVESKVKNFIKKVAKENNKECNKNDIQDSKISYCKSGKRKSLTISRAQSPETVQVIRVDVVCNYRSGSATSDREDNQKVYEHFEVPDTKMEREVKGYVKNSHFANKYLLTKTIKTLDENLPNGTKVTLLCKTFKLSDRIKMLEKSKISERKGTKVINNIKMKFKK